MSDEKNKFSKIWRQYRALIIGILAISGVALPIQTGIITIGDAVAEVQTSG